ncbi:MAG: B12-binding domain-containing radical SAM protein [Candidatus Bruticola sp.]
MALSPASKQKVIALISIYIVENNGIRFLASALRSKGWRVIEIYFKDYQHHHFTNPSDQELSLLIDVLRREKADIIGLSVRAGGYYKFASKLSIYLHKTLSIPVIWGGMHVTMSPETALECCQGVSIGEAEETICELMEAVETGSSWKGIAGLWYKEPNGTVVRNPLRPLQDNLDAIPFRDFHSHQFKYYIDNNSVTLGDPYINQTIYLMMSARGCLFNCAYCDISALRKVYKNLGNFYRVMSPARTIEECLYAKQNFPHLRRFRFDDELFCLRKEWVDEFCRLYKEKVKLPFEILTDPRVTDRDLLMRLKDVGLDTVMMGIQHISQVNKRLYNRNVADEKVLEAGRILHELNLKACYQILLDDPHVTSAEKRQLFELLVKIPRPYDLYLFSLSYWPQTDITERYLADGTITPEQIEGRNNKCLKQFRVSLSWPRPTEDTFWYSIYTLLSKRIPLSFIKLLANSSLLRRFPQPLCILAQTLNFFKLAELAWQMLRRGELTWDTVKRWVNFKSLPTS